MDARLCRAKMALSPLLQATIWNGLMSLFTLLWLSVYCSPFLSFLIWKPLILGRPRFTKNKCILLSDFFSFFISMHIVDSSQFTWQHLFVGACECEYTGICIQACSLWAFAAENPDCVPSLMLLHIVIPRSRCNMRLFRNPTINHLNYCQQTSKRLPLAAHFISISNTLTDRNTKEQKLHWDMLCVGWAEHHDFIRD